jgi:signal transduction histidine kinase
MFEPFFSTRIGEGGTGLGMSIVQSIVTKTLGGSLQVQSEPGQGTRFDIILPLEAPSALD